jgi:ketosteroid isomerase-like protein
MSDETVALAYQWREAFNRGDLDWMLEHSDEEVEFVPLRAKTEGVFHGHDGVRRFWKDTLESFEVFQSGELFEVHDLGDRVLWIGTIRVKGRGSGIETEVPTASIAAFRDGLLVHFKDYGDRDEALAAAGLG